MVAGARGVLVGVGVVGADGDPLGQRRHVVQVVVRRRGRWYRPSEAMVKTLPSLRTPERPQSSSGTEA
jgi:hypothetical protein